MLQFTALIVFLISAVTVFRQNRYASTEALNVSTNQVVTVQMPSCLKSFADRVRALPGVTGAACASVYALERAMNWSILPSNGGPQVQTLLIPVDYGFLEFFDIRADAGRLFQVQSDDAIPENLPPETPVRYVVNEAAVHALGYTNAQAAVGHPIFDRTLPGVKEGAFPGIIIGVVKDFSFTPEIYGGMTKDGRIPPIVYSIGMPAAHLPAPPATLYIQLTGRDVPQSLAAIDAAWTQSGQTNPIFRDSLNEWVQNRISSYLKIAQAFAAFAIVAMLLGCFGLFGISLFAVERRTKEIGVRKAMGATSRQILSLLLWQFSWPILWANLIAWPLAWWLMQMLLSNFPYRVDLPLWTFLAAGIVTLAIALATVAGQAVLVARQKPVLALRYE
jgi:putative ABC transport system permease protein